LLASEPVISEFLANNVGSALDEDGEATDWIEVHNPSEAIIDLTGWHLTDDAANKLKWTFPATEIEPGGFLLVYASGKDRAVSGAELHTNFGLASGGEYLALVAPDGITVSTEWADYPPQQPGVSYGLAQQIQSEPILTEGATGKILVPNEASQLPADWNAIDLNDDAWDDITLGVGFDEVGQGSLATETMELHSVFQTQTFELGLLTRICG